MAATRLKSGTFLLWPYTLDRAWSMLSMSSPHGRLVCPGPPSRSPFADIHAARRSLRDYAGTAVPTWLLRVVAVCFTTCFAPFTIGLGGSGSSSHAGAALRCGAQCLF